MGRSRLPLGSAATRFAPVHSAEHRRTALYTFTNLYSAGMGQASPVRDDPDLQRLLGLPFTDSDEVIAEALQHVSIPALLMSLVHMTGDLSLFDQLPTPAMLIPMDVQGAMSEPDKETVRKRALEIIADYRDRGCPPAWTPDDNQLQQMLAVLMAGDIDAKFLDYIAADLRLSDADQYGPELASTAEQRAGFPVLIIGAGEAGIVAGVRLQAAGIPFTIVDKQDGVGGTWLANHYPGCRVDITNQYYTYSFEPTDHWTHHYAKQPEILRYLNDVTDRHDLRPHLRLNTRVESATWDDDAARWNVETVDAQGNHETLTAAAVICAVGQFGNAQIPDIPGVADFAGPVCHTAAWRDDLALAGKRVAVVGAGASGFQLVPAIADTAAHVDVYQRTPQWFAPNIAYHDGIPDGARWAIRHLPFYGRWLRLLSWWPLADGGTETARIDPDWDDGGLSCGPANRAFRDLLVAWIQAFTSDADLLAKVVPSYPPMGKRLLQDNGTWLKTLQRDDVELVTDPIAAIDATGIRTADGIHRDADVLIWATGFDVNHQLGPITIRGVDGVDLAAAWGDSPYAYLGVTVPGFPNLFCMYGPGTNAVNGASIIYNSECQMRYALACIDLLLASGARRLEPRAEVCAQYTDWNSEQLRGFVYTHPAVVSSYFRNSAGDVPTLYGGLISDYWRRTSSADPADYEFY